MMNDCLMGTVFPLGVIKMPWNYTEVMVAQHCKWTKWHWMYTLKWLILLSYISPQLKKKRICAVGGQVIFIFIIKLLCIFLTFYEGHV